MKRMIEFPSIEQFRGVVKKVKDDTALVGLDENNEEIYDYLKPKPILNFKMTEKIHGSNMGVCYSNPDKLWFQSRENIITGIKDNAGCAFTQEANSNAWLHLMDLLSHEHNIDLNKNIITIYAEWCGGKIQKNSAVSGLDKRAIVFSYFKVSPIEPNEDEDEDEVSYWLETKVNGAWIDSKEYNIFNINNFKIYSFTIDFNSPERSQNTIIELVETMEENSPVGQAFGIQNNVAEGIVAECMWNNQLLMFKVKGEKHSKSKVKTLKVVDTEKLDKIDKCVEEICHNWRFEQAIVEIFGSDYENTIDIKKISEVIKWVNSDTLKEESSIIADYRFEPKEILPKVSQKTKEYFFSIYNSLK